MARVKVESFNFTRYGLIDGTVLGLTRDAVDPGNGQNQAAKDDANAKTDGAQKEPFYLARISLTRDWMQTENGQVSLAPGMAVTAEIQTGHRRIIRYLLSPLFKLLVESGHER